MILGNVLGNSLAVANIAIRVGRGMGVIVRVRRWVWVGGVVLDGRKVGERMYRNSIKNLWS